MLNQLAVLLRDSAHRAAPRRRRVLQRRALQAVLHADLGSDGGGAARQEGAHDDGVDNAALRVVEDGLLVGQLTPGEKNGQDAQRRALAALEELCVPRFVSPGLQRRDVRVHLVHVRRDSEPC